MLTGAGPHAFCAGADLKEISAGRGATLSTEKGGFAGFVRAPRRKLWIAAANGHALAGGLELLLACDLAVAAEGATFGLPEVKRSLVAAAGGVFRLPRALPKAVALRMIATGEPISAADALRFGLVNEVVPAGEVLAAALTLAAAVCANAPVAVRESLGGRPSRRGPGRGRAVGVEPRRRRPRPRNRGLQGRAARLRGEAPAALDRAVAGAGNREESGCTAGHSEPASAASPSPRRDTGAPPRKARGDGRAGRSRWSPASGRAPPPT